MIHRISCSCGKLKGTLNYQKRNINRCVCYCDDCQAFARFLKREDETLDSQGGTTIIQTLPANVTFTEGIENLACMRLTENGLLRWYAACCNTPIGNTPANSNICFVGLVHNCLDGDSDSFDESFGTKVMQVHTKDAIGEDKPKPARLLSGTLRMVGMMLKARLDGRDKDTPFFVMESGTPVATPKVLNEQEFKDVMDGVK